MAFRSAAVVIREFDFSQFAPALGLATFAVIGGARKGDLNKPRTFTSEIELVNAHGTPLATDYAMHAAIRFLAKGNKLVFSRIANGAVVADYPVPGLSGGTPAVKATSTISFDSSNNPTDGEYITLHKYVPWLALMNDNNGAAGNVTIALAGTGVTTRIQVSGMSGGTVSTPATGFVKFIGSVQPNDGDQIIISDGTTVVTFEFDSDASVSETANLRQVVIGADAYATMAALLAKLMAHAFAVSAVNQDVSKAFEFDNNGSFVSGRVGVTIGATAAATLLNLMTAISNQVATLGFTVANTTTTVPQLTLTQGTGGLDGNAKTYESSANITVAGFSGGVDAVAGSVITALAIQAASPGSWGNDIQVEFTATSMIGAEAGSFDLIVRAPVDDTGTLEIVERYQALSLDSDSDRFIELVLSEGLLNEYPVASSYVRADVTVNAAEPTVGTYELGDAPGNAGLDGVGSLVVADYVGTISGQSATGLKALRNPETVQFNILAIPGVSHKDVLAAAQDLVQTRADAILLIDPPFGLTRDQVIDWHNGESLVVANAPVEPFNSSFLAVYWPWVKDRDQYSGRDLWLPPSGFVAGVFAYTDKVAGPWYAPAGHSRGPIDGKEVEYEADQSERDLLNAGNNRINPITRFADGLKVFGNRTTQRRATKLDSVHTRRLMLHLEAVVANSVKFLVFDPASPLTWRKAELLVQPVLDNLKAQQGLEEAFVKCDKDNNPVQLRAANSMRLQVGVKPFDSAEIIYADFALFATGAELTTQF